jgi:hypothetical protein
MTYFGFLTAKARQEYRLSKPGEMMVMGGIYAGKTKGFSG